MNTKSGGDLAIVDGTNPTLAATGICLDIPEAIVNRKPVKYEVDNNLDPFNYPTL